MSDGLEAKLAQVRAILEQIEGGHFVTGDQAAEEGDWFEVAFQMQRAARAGIEALASITELIERLSGLADELDRAARDRQAWADHPGIGGDKPKLASHLRGKRYGYSHAAQLIRAALNSSTAPA